MTASPAQPAVVLGRTAIHETAVSALVVRCGGEIDSLNAHHLATAVGEGLAEIATTATHAPSDRRVLVIDLREVTFFGASAVTALIEGVAEAPTDVVDMRLVVGDTRPVLLVVDALDLRATFSIHRALPDALHHQDA